MLVSKATGFKDRTGQSIDEGDMLRLHISDLKDVGVVQEFNGLYWLVFRKGQQTILSGVAEWCTVITNEEKNDQR